jgi:hypothetical protein
VSKAAWGTTTCSSGLPASRFGAADLAGDRRSNVGVAEIGSAWIVPTGTTAGACCCADDEAMAAQITRPKPKTVCAAAFPMHFHLDLRRVMVMPMAFLTSIDPTESSQALPILGNVGPVRDDAAGATVGALIGIMTSPPSPVCAQPVGAHVNGREEKFGGKLGSRLSSSPAGVVPQRNERAAPVGPASTVSLNGA